MDTNITPLISIITPTYNHEHYISECIESVLLQTYPNWEMIIIDDGSTDSTWPIVQEYAQRDQRIRAFHQKNKGIWRLGETYNFALSQSNGQYIAILEGDDYWSHSKLEIQVSCINSCADLIFLYSNTVFVNNSKEVLDGYIAPFSESTIFESEYFMKSLLLRKNMVFPATVMIKRQALESIGGFYQPNYPAVDNPTWLSISSQNGKVFYDNRILAFYRQHSSQITSTKNIQMIEGRLNIALDFFDRLPSNIRDRLGIDKSVIREAHMPYISPMFIGVTRIYLKERNFRKSLYYASRLSYYGGIKNRIQASYSIIVALLKKDVEHIYYAYSIVTTTGRFVNRMFCNIVGISK